MVKKLRICSAVSIEYRRVTDRQTDRQTILRRHSPPYAYASSGKIADFENAVCFEPLRLVIVSRSISSNFVYRMLFTDIY